MKQSKNGGSGLGAGGHCICLKCNKKIPHKSGTPCMDERCPDCKSAMVREGSPHHKVYLEQQENKRKNGEK